MGGKKTIGTNPTRGNCYVSARGGRIQRTNIPSVITSGYPAESDNTTNANSCFPNSEIQEFSLFSNLGIISGENKIGSGSHLALPWLLSSNYHNQNESSNFSSQNDIIVAQNQFQYSNSIPPNQNIQIKNDCIKDNEIDVITIMTAISRIEEEIIKINEQILTNAANSQDKHRINERISTLEGRQGAIQSKGIHIYI